MKITRATQTLRVEFFKTLPRSETTGISVLYTDTVADPRIDAAAMDYSDAMRGFFGCAYHYLIKATGEVEIGRDPTTRTSRGYAAYREFNVMVGVDGGRDAEGNRVQTVTTEQREAVEWLLQSIANVLQVPLEISGNIAGLYDDPDDVTDLDDPEDDEQDDPDLPLVG